MKIELKNINKTETHDKQLLKKLDEIFKPLSRKQTEEVEKFLTKEVPNIQLLLSDKKNFIPSSRFNKKNSGEVEYIPEEMSLDTGKLKFFHELCHKIMKHSGEVFNSECLENERAAWFYAVKTAEKMGIECTDELRRVVIDCFDVYQKHSQERRTCIACGSKNSTEFAPQQYTCKDCYCDW